MKAKSFLLTVPLAVSTLTFFSLPANAVCWSWKPCADLQGYGYGAATESQGVLPPLPPGVDAQPEAAAAPGATATPGPAGAPEHLKPAKKPAATATAAPAPAKPKPAPVPAQAKAAPPPAA